MIKIEYIYPVLYVDFNDFKKYTTAKRVRDWYWLYTDNEDDLYQPWKTRESRLAEPAMLAAYADGELCEPDVDEIGDVVPIIIIKVINDPDAEEYLLVKGNKIEFADISWSVCNYHMLIADSSIGKSMFNTKELGIKYKGSVLEQYLNNWLDQHQNDPVKIPKE